MMHMIGVLFWPVVGATSLLAVGVLVTVFVMTRKLD
jgi:hypothetical protein